MPKGIYRKLMGGKTTVFWGRRAFITLRIPESDYPVPYPILEPWILARLGDKGDFAYTKKNDDGTVTQVHVSELHCRNDPRIRKDSRDRVILFPELRYKYSDGDESWVFWEALAFTGAINEHGFVPRDGAQIADCETPGFEWLKDYASYRRDASNWHRDNEEVCPWKFEIEASCPILRAYNEAKFWSKTTYFQIHGGYYYLTFSVKTHYARDFSRAFSRLFRNLRNHGIKAKTIGCA